MVKTIIYNNTGILIAKSTGVVICAPTVYCQVHLIYLETLKCSSMAAAARRPSPIARITVAPPLTISPPA